MSTSRSRKYGWIPDLPDQRDLLYQMPRSMFGKLPDEVDLRYQMPPVYDQGDLGSCTANAIGSAHQYNQIRQSPKTPFSPSRLFLYWNTRKMINTTEEDSGGMIRDGVKSIVKQGVCEESDWPYVIDQFKVKPADPCYAHALNHQAIRYQRLSQEIYRLKSCLAEGFPVIFGFSLYESFESPQVYRTGIIPMPGRKEKLLGGHAVLLVGYSQKKNMWIVRNSWGSSWGVKGYCFFPFPYLINPDLACDFWTIRSVETGCEKESGLQSNNQ